MRTSVECTLFLFVTLTLSTVAAQPNIALNFSRLQSSVLEIYNRFHANVSSVDLTELMDSRLTIHTFQLIDRIRSWDFGNSRNVNEGLNYLRCHAVFLCIEYADGLYDAYCAAGYMDADVILQASQIYQILSNRQCNVAPSDPSTCFEVLQFVRRGILVRTINNAPYLQLSSNNIGPARFLHEVIESEAFICNAGPSTPILVSPSANLRREVEALNRAQNIVFRWYRNHNAQNLTAQMFDKNKAFRENLKNLAQSFFQEFDTSGIYASSRIPWEIISIVVLQRYIEFMLSEYQRHHCHPAHRAYAHTLNSNITERIKRTNILLNSAHSNLDFHLQNTINNNSLLSAFRAHISNIPFQAVYSQYSGPLKYLKLRLVWPCQTSQTNQTEG